MTHVSDELLSAMVDNEAAPASDDVAHLDGCAQCQGRLGVFRGVAHAVAAPTPLPAAHLREAAVAAALVETSGATATLRRLVSSKRGRSAPTMAPTRTPARRISPLSAAAALVVALAVGGWAISQSGTPNSTDSSAFADGDQRTNSAPADMSNQAKAFAGDAESVAGFYDAGDMGTLTDIAEVEAWYQRFWATPEDERRPRGSMVTSPCPAPSDQPVTWHATLTYDGVAAYARTLFVTESTQVLEVLAQTDCAVLATQEIAPTTPR